MPQRVDPFIPVTNQKKPYAAPTGQYGSQYLRNSADMPAPTRPVHPVVQRLPMEPTHSRAPIINDVVRPATHDAHQSVPHNSHSFRFKHRAKNLSSVDTHKRITAPAVVTPRRLEQDVKTRVHKMPQYVQILWIMLGAACVGLFIQSLVFGEFAIGLYAIYALVRRVSSRTTFILALIALIGIVVLQILHGGETTISDNFAVYAFLLLAVGTISLGFEVRRESVSKQVHQKL